MTLEWFIIWFTSNHKRFAKMSTDSVMYSVSKADPNLEPRYARISWINVICYTITVFTLGYRVGRYINTQK